MPIRENAEKARKALELSAFSIQEYEWEHLFFCAFDDIIFIEELPLTAVVSIKS